ncbi:LysR substrate-binding domain-containing protein [Cupriavidus consociatus]|uniref:LysR substrate-binding domain-containing protein n=1 Tax=Cupriavidus consociatus TaxID=2821357 RepID=UPI001AE20101|nr:MULTISPECIES: LysR substrate-binding domain-containing protein [unclassified Cupriavidus]MBP0619816.1 LysR family transcriptional regulator [Cupriavidus sp. LEh25]MDK2656468.1 LysR substrate-binding domain-containing protein [Cupriavidus sp. LEh21]
MKAPAPPALEIFRNRVRLRHLYCFVAVSQTQHLGRAADRLGLTQPAVSKTLSELEELTGTRLLVRQRAGTELTTAGTRFLRHALRILADIDAAADSMAGEQAQPQERIRLGALPSVVPAVLTDALLRFRAAHPEVGLAVQTGMNRSLIDQLKADVLDLVIGRMDDPVAMESLWFESLGPDSLALAVRPGHPLAAIAVSRRPTLLDVLAWPLVIPAAGSIPRHNTESLLARHGLPLPGGCVETSDAYLGRLLARNSDCVWAAPLSAAQRAVAEDELILLPLDTQGTEEPIGLLRHGDRTLSPMAEALADCIRAAARPLAAQ